MKLLDSITLREASKGRYAEYRIPGIVATENGTLICVCEGRMASNDDWATIDTLLMRSEDGGANWTETVFTFPCDGAQTVNNPTLIADGSKVHLLFNLNYARAFCSVSEDDGRHWSEPCEITDAYREFAFDWNVCAAGPGHGIADGRGRLIAPIWLANGEKLDDRRIRHQPSVSGLIVSDDGGKTWHAGALTEGIKDANETCLCALKDGQLLCNFRNLEPDHRRRLAIASADGRRFESVWSANDLRDPYCFGGMCNLPNGDALFVHCDSETRARVHITAARSSDSGKSWTTLAEIDPVGGYADVAVYKEHVYVLYETTDAQSGVITALTLKHYTLNED